MSKLQINLHQDFQPAARLPSRNLQFLSGGPLSSKLSFLLSTLACLAGLFLINLLF